MKRKLNVLGDFIKKVLIRYCSRTDAKEYEFLFHLKESKTGVSGKCKPLLNANQQIHHQKKGKSPSSKTGE